MHRTMSFAPSTSLGHTTTLKHTDSGSNSAGSNRHGTMESTTHINSNNNQSPALKLVEAHRAIALLAEVVDKLAFLGSITPDVMQHRDELSKFLGDEISKTLQEQRRLEAQYEQLITQRAALKSSGASGSSKARYKDLQMELQAVSHALRQSTNQLCRNLKENPNVSGNLLKIEKEREDLMEAIEKTMRELKSHGTFNTLAERVEEDRASQERLSRVVQQEKETAAAVAQVEAELRTETEAHKRIVTEHSATITRLKQELQEIKYKTVVETKYARREAKAKAASVQRVFHQEEKDLEVQLSELRAKQEVEQKAHDTLLQYLKDKQRDLTEQVESWNQKMTDDLGELQTQHEKLTQKRNGALQKLDALRHRKKLEMAEKAEKEDLERKRLEEQKRQNKINTQRNAAARAIQAAIRVYVGKKKAEEEARLAAKKAKLEAKNKKAKGKK